MSEQEKNIHQYGAEDLERYHSGQMTEQEMHALEKAALDDPFLMDALDGYAHTTTATADIVEIRNRLLEKGDTKKIIWYKRNPFAPLLKIAAVLILFSGFGLLLYKNNNAPVKKEIASAGDDLNKDQIEKIITNRGTDSIRNTWAEAPAIVKTEPGKTTEQSAPILKNKTEAFLNTEPVTVSAGATSTLTLEQNGNSLSDSVRLSPANNYYSQTDNSNNNLDRTFAGKLPGFQAIPSRTIKGRVTDSKGSPVAYASIVDKKNNQAVPVDQEGTFAFTTSDSAPLVNVNAVGYAPISKELSDDSRQNNFVLQDAYAGLNEAIVTSALENKRKQEKSPSFKYKYQGKDKKAQRISITNAIPVNGWQRFNNYVNDSLKTVEQLGPNSSSVEILVSFDVNDIGEPIDIHVQRSLCIPCEAEALRIIKNGPHWILNKKRKKANAVIRF